MNGNDTLFDGRPSLLTVVGPLIRKIVWIGLCGVAYILLSRWVGLILPHLRVHGINRATLQSGLLILVGLLVLINLLSILWIVITLVTTRYRVTPRYIEMESGVFMRRVDTIELARIRDITLLQPFLMRLFDVGNLEIISTDSSSPRKVLSGISSPRRLWGQLRELVRPGVVHEFR